MIPYLTCLLRSDGPIFLDGVIEDHTNVVLYVSALEHLYLESNNVTTVDGFVVAVFILCSVHGLKTAVTEELCQAVTSAS